MGILLGFMVYGGGKMGYWGGINGVLGGQNGVIGGSKWGVWGAKRGLNHEKVVKVARWLCFSLFCIFRLRIDLTKLTFSPGIIN